ncbi:hypothetical protein [uncultured Fibrobacter sp.]|jgi:hypothetical protein|uniref:hypothetical protein n=1 Tax=uncultured Fibrobacter sp. TaxID=261512 RepID=UPI001562F9E9|nr:hypothetical protein [uncultured Fibrobacter sp.]
MVDDYKDIINLPYPRDDWNFLMKHPRMSMEDRAKIFAPFAALRGHSTALAKTAEKKLDSVEHELTLEDPDAVMMDEGAENF